MTSKELNELLVHTFPELQEEYSKCVDWQEGDYTGATVTYGDVLCPHLKECVHQKNEEKIKQLCMFIESVLLHNDEYADTVISCSVLEEILDDNDRIRACKPYMGSKTIKKSIEICKGYFGKDFLSI